LDFKGTCDDPDLLYGDELTFIWSSDIDGELGTGRNLSNIKLSVGEHNITLEVLDNASENTSITITIIVNYRKDDSSLDEQSNMYIIIMAVVVIILIVIFAYLLMIYLRKAKSTDKKNKTKTQSP